MYSPEHQPPVRQARAGELLYEFVRKWDHVHVRCDLVDKRQSLGGVEIKSFIRDELSMTYRFDSRPLAELWAKELLRRDLERGGA